MNLVFTPSAWDDYLWVPLARVLHSVLVIPLTTNLDRANLAGTAVVSATARGLAEDSVALAFQMRAIPKVALQTRSGASRRCRTVSSAGGLGGSSQT